MNPDERRNKILELIKDQNNDIKELAKILNTSIPTIYRDIRTLLKKNKIKKNYNDIKIIDNIEENYKNIIITKLGQRIEQNKIEKISIAKEAAKLVNTGDNIILDESSTSYYLAKELKNRNIPITIITNSVLIPQEFLENNLVRIINTGGVLDSEVGGFVGTFSENSLKDLHAKIFFFSAAGISEEKGVMDAYFPEIIRMKKIFLTISDEAILMADSSKFNKKGILNWAQWDNIQKLIIDSKTDKAIIKNLYSKGIEVLVSKE